MILFTCFLILLFIASVSMVVGIERGKQINAMRSTLCKIQWHAQGYGGPRNILSKGKIQQAILTDLKNYREEHGGICDYPNISSTELAHDDAAHESEFASQYA